MLNHSLRAAARRTRPVARVEQARRAAHNTANPAYQFHSKTAVTAAENIRPRQQHDPCNDVPPPKIPFWIVDSTLREGEQFSTAEFTSQDRLYIAKTLDQLGVDYIEVVNPMAGQQALDDCEAISSLNLHAKVVTHTRCHMDDVKLAVNSGVNGVSIYMATSSILRGHSHGKGIDEIIDIAGEVIGYVKKHGLEVRFSCEDSFRSSMDDLLKVYSAIDKLGVNRVGIADTVGVATPSQVMKVVGAVRKIIKPTTGMEFHGHNDTGCAIANSLAALESGATHINTSVLGVGERNGIPSLGGFLARMYTLDKEHVAARYRLPIIPYLDRYVAQRCDVSIPFNHYVTGSAAFTHKAGVHSKAVMQNPNAYEVISPADFGVERQIQVGHRLTGWNAMAQTAKNMGLNLTPEQVKTATIVIKNLSDSRRVGSRDVETILRRLDSANRDQNNNSVFVRWADPELSMEDRLELASMELAENNDTRPSMCVKVTGHLFDKALLNRMLDLAVESPCEFNVVRLDAGAKNHLKSTVILQIRGKTMEEVQTLRQQLADFCKVHEPIAACTLQEYTMAHAMRDQAAALKKMRIASAGEIRARDLPPI